MNTEKYKRYCFPSPQQELLLRAALLRGKDAIEAWKEWKSCVDVEQVDSGSHRMLPLLYHNLQTHGIKDPSMDKYKGVYRQTWYKNHLLFHHCASLLHSFHDCGITTMVLKGAALVPLYYKDYGLRPMADFDVLVYTEQAVTAINLLRKLGWEPMSFSPTERYISVSYSHGFKDTEDRELDLHWHVFSQSRKADADRDFWDGAVEITVNNVPTHALNPTDQLLHVCVHGTKWDVVPTIRWVADAMVILTTSPSEVDWNRLIAQAQKLSLVLPLKDTLKYLKDTFDAPLKSEILQSIHKIPVPKIERIEYKVTISQPTRWIALLDLWCQHLRLMGNVTLLQKIIQFPRFLQNIWGIALWKIPFHGVFKMMTWYKNRLAKRFTHK